jgi:hypothetical protein
MGGSDGLSSKPGFKWLLLKRKEQLEDQTCGGLPNQK